MGKKSLQDHYNEGQRDGAKKDYVGTLFSGRNREEHAAYNKGYENGRKNRSGSDAGAPTSKGEGYWGDRKSKEERAFKGKEADTASTGLGASFDGDGFWEDLGEKAGAIGGGLGALAGLATAVSGGFSSGWTIAYAIIGAMIGGGLANILTRFFPFIIMLFVIAGVLKACS